MSTKEYESAFPVPEVRGVDDRLHQPNYTGMSLQEYAAIHLRVPRSDCAWLDDMIREAQRNEFAARAITALAPEEIPWASIARRSKSMADAMMAELEKKS